MAHIRTQVREAVKTALRAALGTDAVIGRRAHTLAVEALPLVEVTTPDESVQRETQARPALQSRVVDVTITIYAAATEDVEDDADALAATVEATLHADPTLGGIVRDMETTGGEFGVEQPGELTIGRREVRLQVLAHTREGAPETAL